MVIIFVAAQILVFILTPDSFLNMVVGITGILCVIFVSKGKISNYFFGLVWAYTYFYASWNANLIGEMTSVLFIYIPAQFLGFFLWRDNMKKSENQKDNQVELVEAKSLTLLGWVVTIAIAVVGTFLFIEYIKLRGGSQATLDGFSTVLTVIAQVLMVLRYREQWVVWIVINIISMALWWESLSVSFMYLVYLFNAIYGWYNWCVLAKETKARQQALAQN